jgi:cobalt-zinc-cadmium efflux system outer membrane protein
VDWKLAPAQSLAEGPSAWSASCIGLLLALSGCHAGHPSQEQVREVNSLYQQRAATPWSVERLFADDTNLSEPTGSLTRQTATAAALEHNLTLRALAENLSIAHAQLVQAGLLPNPTFGQSGSFAFPIHPLGGLTPFDLLFTESINGILTQPTRAAEAKLEEAQADIDLATQAYSLEQQVDSKYQEMVHLVRALKLLEKIRDLYSRAVQAAEARRKVGIIPTPELNRAKLSYEDAVRQVRHLTTQYGRAAREMNSLMGYAGPPQWHLPENATDDAGAVPAFPNAEALEPLGLRFRMDLLRADFDRKLSDKGIILAKFGMIPPSEVGLDYAWDSNHHHTIGPQFQTGLPIFDPGLVGLELAKAQKRKADKTYTALEAQVRQDVQTAFDNWRIALDDITFFRARQLPQQEENVRLMELSFRLGNDDLDTLLNVYQNYISQLQAYEDALQAYHDSTLALQQAIGLTWDRIREQFPATTRPSTEPKSSATQPELGQTPGTMPSTKPTTEQSR